MLENQLIASFQGEGYDEEVIVSYNKGEAVVLFKGLSYLLISSFDGELQMNLNFGGKTFLPHTLRNVDDKLILIPRFYRLGSGRYPSMKMYLDIDQYLSLAVPRILTFPKIDLARLWNGLQYEHAELDHIGEASEDDLVQMWLLSSGHQVSEQFPPFTDTYTTKVLSSIVAEESPGEISIKQVIEKIINGKFTLELPTLSGLKGAQFHLVYLLNEDNSVSEWKALAMVNSDMYIILDEILIGITLL
jgi:hypothetical protein